jgi:hypothetical protein
VNDSFKKMFGGTAGLLIAFIVICCVGPMILSLLGKLGS